MMSLGLGTKLGSVGGGSYGIGGREASYSNEYAMFLDGSESVGVLNSTDITNIFRGDHTYSFWVWDAAFGTTYACGISKPTAPDHEIGVRFLNIGTMYLQVFHDLDGTGGNAFYNVGSSLTTSNWHQITVTCEKGASGSDKSTIKLYLDGTLVGTNINGPTKEKQDAFSAESGQLFGVGARYGSNNSPALHSSAYFDEFAFWSTALDADAVSAIYNSGASIDLSQDSGDYDNSSNLESWYRFENNFDDSQANSSEGVAEGDPSFQTNFGIGGSQTPP